MRILLRAEFPNGRFGDPALYVWEINESDSILVDCGDLSRFTTRQLLKTRYLLLSHCHIDHFYGFDHLLRVHMGSEKVVTIFGPPETSQRVEGKLAGYTWNLIADQALEFQVVELDASRREKRRSRFTASNRFRRVSEGSEPWSEATPVLDLDDTGVYRVRAVELDHRTPSMAYAIEEKLTITLRQDRLAELGLKPGAWIGELKSFVLFGRRRGERILAPTESGESRSFDHRELVAAVLEPRQRHKIAYATDGAACEANRQKLLPLIEGADLFFSETCFLSEDAHLAEQTRHFTAEFIARLARDAGVKALAPFHFSKRYSGCPGRVTDEILAHFTGQIVELAPGAQVAHF